MKMFNEVEIDEYEDDEFLSVFKRVLRQIEIVYYLYVYLKHYQTCV